MNEYELIILGGTIVDGTGAPPKKADIGITGDRLTAIAPKLPRDASRIIDATDRVVTPGFFDPHTHLDAQIGWDPMAKPLCWHGVTSAVMGNCGVTFAPCATGAAEILAGLMEAVEELPARTILSALPWDWTGYDEYLATVARLPKAINIGGLVGHAAIRTYAMGAERALDPDAEPTDLELSAMRKAVEQAIEAGALGVSASRTLRHTVPDGRPIPGTFAKPRELHALCQPLKERGRGLFEIAARLGDKEDYAQWQVQVAGEMDLMFGLSVSTQRAVTFSLFNHRDRPEIYEAVLSDTARRNAAGAQLRPQVAARRINELYGFAHNSPFNSVTWDALGSLPLSERLAILDDEQGRARLINEAGNGCRVPVDRLFLLGSELANYEYGEEDSLVAQAARLGVSPVTAFIQIARETQGRAVWAYDLLNHLTGGIERMITDPHSVLGLGDTGAHLDRICDSSLTTYVLKHWVRDREVLSLEEGIRRLTWDPARLFGQEDRGVLRVGAYADLNVIDLGALSVGIPEYTRDLPEGAGMWTQRASGYDYTIVNGQILMDHGEYAGSRAGQMLA